MFHSCCLVTCDAGIVAIVHQSEVGDAQGAGEIDVVDGDTKTGWDRPPVLLPCDEDRLVTRHDHTGDEHSLADGEPREFKWLDGWWNCGKDFSC